MGPDHTARRALADALRRRIAAGIPLDGASDHGISKVLYLRNPDDNGVELNWTRPLSEWPRPPDGELAMFTRRLDLNGLLKEVESVTESMNVGEGPRNLYNL